VGRKTDQGAFEKKKIGSIKRNIVRLLEIERNKCGKKITILPAFL
jgi:hypothetical protein